LILSTFLGGFFAQEKFTLFCERRTGNSVRCFANDAQIVIFDLILAFNLVGETKSQFFLKNTIPGVFLLGEIDPRGLIS
jgi:hypothetical protein